MADNNPYQPPGAHFPQPIDSGVPVLAGRGQRLGAAIIDSLILGAIIMPVIFMLFGFQVAVKHPFLYPLGGNLLAFGVFMLVNGHFLSQSGQTIGKKIVGIKIVRTDGSQPDLAWLATRRVGPIYLAQMIPFIGSLLVTVEVLFIFRDSRQCIHDTLADTIVVNA